MDVIDIKYARVCPYLFSFKNLSPQNGGNVRAIFLRLGLFCFCFCSQRPVVRSQFNLNGGLSPEYEQRLCIY
jgi:hypothetical protein